MQGILTISLDFELHWGVFDKKDRSGRTACYKNTLALIPELLQLFEKHKVNVTWATVGSMFAQDRKEWDELKPSIQPHYSLEKYSAYKWVEQNGLPEQQYFAHFAPSEVASILQYSGQELGTHTFSHYYCLEKQDGYQAFDADLQAVKKTALKFQNNPVSLVFPRNQFNDECLKICYNNDIRVVRSNPNSWFWTPIPNEESQLVRKVFRTGDAYLKLGKRTSYPLDTIRPKNGHPIQLPASRFLRPWNEKYKWSNTFSLRRVLNELKEAATHKECYHLWWHPENFGDYPEQNIQNLKTILQEYDNCKQKHGMVSWNMGEYATNLG